MSGPRFFELVLDAAEGTWHVRCVEDAIDPADLREAASQLEVCQEAATQVLRGPLDGDRA